MKPLKYILLFFVIFSSCTEELIPKPKAFLRLSYTDVAYQQLKTDCPYTFEVSQNSKVNFNDKCWLTIYYPNLKGSLNITYLPIENNLKDLLIEAEKLTYNHAVKADGISAQPYDDSVKKKYGALSEVTGNAASPLQFHLTDSTKHFITGALYFEVQPNYDSILPAVKHIEKDIIHIMETLTWKN